MKLFELRACWTEYYACPDNGPTKICDTYETIGFAIDDDAQLQVLARDLAAGFKGGFWNEKRARQLRQIYPGYDNHRDTEYKIVDVSELIILTPNSGLSSSDKTEGIGVIKDADDF
jgi:hypothetical protein